jgi:hypothetical protein
MKAYRGTRGIPPLILEVGTRRHGSTSFPGHCTPGKNSGIDSTVGWAGPSDGLDVKKREKSVSF